MDWQFRINSYISSQFRSFKILHWINCLFKVDYMDKLNQQFFKLWVSWLNFVIKDQGWSDSPFIGKHLKVQKALIYLYLGVIHRFGQFHTWGLDSNGESNSIRKRRKQSTFSLEPMEPPKKAPTQHEELGSHTVCSGHPMQVVSREMQRRAAEEEWKVKSIPNAKTNASKLATATLVVMEWA
ncbi:hypothetical protein AAG906_018645 [Vitis piasezkii]